MGSSFHNFLIASGSEGYEKSVTRRIDVKAEASDNDVLTQRNLHNDTKVSICVSSM